METIHIDNDISLVEVFSGSRVHRTGPRRCPNSGPVPTTPLYCRHPNEVKLRQQVINEGAADLAVAARGFSKAMKAPKLIRVIWPNTLRERTLVWEGEWDVHREQEQVFALDCLTNKTRAFRRGYSWNSVGHGVNLEEEVRYWSARLNIAWDEAHEGEV